MRAPSDASAAEWIAPALGRFGTVGGVIPVGFEHYLVVDYRRAEPLGWDGVSRLFAQLDPVLTSYTETPDVCWFGIWEGYGFDTTQTMVAGSPTTAEERAELDRRRRLLRDEDDRRNDAVREALRSLPMFDLPHRRYFLLRGAVSAASRIERPDRPFRQPPDLWWPNDHRWFVGGDTDLDWCYVGGSAALISAVRDLLPTRARDVDWTESNAAAGERS